MKDKRELAKEAYSFRGFRKKGQLPLNQNKQWKAIRDRKAFTKFNRAKKHLEKEQNGSGKGIARLLAEESADDFERKVRLETDNGQRPAEAKTHTQTEGKDSEGQSGRGTSDAAAREGGEGEEKSGPNPRGGRGGQGKGKKTKGQPDKRNPFWKEIQEAERKKEEQRKAREEKEQERVEREKRIQESQKRRATEKKRLTQKTKKGQLRLGGVVDTLLSKINNKQSRGVR
uniref:rRNA-processing protein FYV7 n=1 Tax=Chromera velia CCMP2878 TaxID=1169474 RepID=A0A0G4G0S0_9ALVE|mmetsp:Transcript_17369/g.35269  ORF Transcript_17369/g.35269 Transcript_17369/m.35269 type:complete len:229 (-) Transcript_17369:182-868(-)|eukprot:Cvel_4016.t1-p1 / transcript=Cvel_4016.t1 / gene=Cvel_4016 / organism=Chromera_velia_CCMP2878 / gene_product=hypothetical protein / transcript_product=hypothetical protein / location=Cvel_scaffold171:8194-11288(-) / protein_length=228 / sequence_SO=supercontig / SO=protein_coding / is_pseudo=false